METTLETINLGNDENPCLTKIGSNLNEKKKKKKKKRKIFKNSSWNFKRCLHGLMRICLELTLR